MFILVDEGMLQNTVEHFLNGAMMIFLITEIATGTIALKNSASHHAKRFYLAQLYEIDDKPDNFK